MLDDDLDSLSVNSVASIFFSRLVLGALLMLSASGVYSVQGPCCFSDVRPKLLPMWVHRAAVLVCLPFACQPKKKEKEKTAFVGSALITPNGLLL